MQLRLPKRPLMLGALPLQTRVPLEINLVFFFFDHEPYLHYVANEIATPLLRCPIVQPSLLHVMHAIDPAIIILSVKKKSISTRITPSLLAISLISRSPPLVVVSPCAKPPLAPPTLPVSVVRLSWFAS